jgi:hypothetical protein
MVIFQKCGPRADLGWPWLIQKETKKVSEIPSKLYIKK